MRVGMRVRGEWMVVVELLHDGGVMMIVVS
jgi:hypothetical protein